MPEARRPVDDPGAPEQREDVLSVGDIRLVSTLAREVQVTSTRANGVIVQGLNGGEDVITTAPATLKNGDKIKIKGQS